MPLLLNEIDRQQLEAVATPTPTRTWRPLQHSLFRSLVMEVLTRTGTTVGETHNITTDGARYFGLLKVARGDTLGLQNSHDKSSAVSIFVGARVGGILSFANEIRVSAKHNVNVLLEMPDLVAQAMKKVPELREWQASRFAAYKSQAMSDTEAHDLVIQAVDAGVIPVRSVPRVLAEWRSAKKTAWTFFNAVTGVIQQNLLALPRRTQKLHGLLDVDRWPTRECGVCK